MQQLYSLLFICLVLALEINAIDAGMRTGRKLQTRHEMSEMAEAEEAEAPGSAIAPEDTGYRTDQTFYCSKDLERYLKKANLTIFLEFPCDKSKSDPPAGSQKCQVTHNRKFNLPERNLIVVVHTPSSRICCELCRAIDKCYSWWRRYSDGHCHINNTYTLGAPSSNAAGGYL